MKKKYALVISDVEMNVVTDAPWESVEKIVGILDRKMRDIHQIQSACAPQRGGHMPLLMGAFHQRHAKHIRHELCMGISNHKAGHIASVHCSGTCTDANSRDFTNLYIGKQPAG